MNDKLKVSFLGSDYSLPSDILVYVQEHHRFEEFRQKMLSSFLSKFSDFEHLPNHIEAMAQAAFNEVADYCISFLVQHGVYNKTQSDYITSNEGVTYFTESLRNSMAEQADILIAETRDFLAGVDAANRAASAQMTGTGLGIISDSLIGFGVWAAMENSALKKQAAEAERQYKAIVDETSRRGELQSKERAAQYNINTWLPNLQKSVNLFILKIFDKFIQDLIESGLFDAVALQYNNIERAEAILENITMAADKQKLLQEAFQQCPYCVAVYQKCLDFDMLDEPAVQTAKVFGTLPALLTNLRRVCYKAVNTENLTEQQIKDKISPHIAVIAMANESSVEAELSKYLDKRRAANLALLRKLGELSPHSEDFDIIMRQAIARTTTDMLARREQGLDLPSIFTDYMTKTTLHGDTADYYDQIKLQVAQELSKSADVYLDEAKSRLEKYKSLAQDHTVFIAAKEKELDALQAQLDSLGLFSFGKKKQLEAEISKMKYEIRWSRENVQKALDRFKRMYAPIGVYENIDDSSGSASSCDNPLDSTSV